MPIHPNTGRLLKKKRYEGVEWGLPGAHYGWAVEGSVGSERKLDAIYLSEHVNWAYRLSLLAMTECLASSCSAAEKV